MPELIETLIQPGLARIEYRHFIVISEASVFAAVLTECAADQGAFWDFHDRYVADDVRLYEWEQALSFADGLGLDLERFTTCMTEGEHLSTVQQAHDEALTRGVNGTPTVFVNGELVEIPSPANIIAAARSALAE